MSNFGLCFLAYGDEHIDEFNVVSSELLSSNPNLHIFVATDDKSKIKTNANIIECFEEFNFNLKRLAIFEAFKQFDTVIMLDTDVKILNKSFSFIAEINTDGMYVKWIDNQLTHKADRLNIHNNEYCVELSKLNNNKLQIQFIPEYCVLIKIEDPVKRIQFTDRWGEIHDKIKDFEPTDRHYDLNGAVEGCIMYLTCLDLDLPVKQSNNLFNSITHYGSTKIENKLI
jgi:hypothetical protein